MSMRKNPENLKNFLGTLSAVASSRSKAQCKDLRKLHPNNMIKVISSKHDFLSYFSFVICQLTGKNLGTNPFLRTVRGVVQKVPIASFVDITPLAEVTQHMLEIEWDVKNDFALLAFVAYCKQCTCTCSNSPIVVVVHISFESPNEIRGMDPNSRFPRPYYLCGGAIMFYMYYSTSTGGNSKGGGVHPQLAVNWH